MTTQTSHQVVNVFAVDNLFALFEVGLSIYAIVLPMSRRIDHVRDQKQLR